MCAKYSLPPFDWLKLSHHLVSGESTLHEVTLFETRSRIFLPTAESCAALLCCRLAIWAWLVGNYRARSIQPKFLEILVQNSVDPLGPAGKVSKKLVHLLRSTTFASRTGQNFGCMNCARNVGMAQAINMQSHQIQAAKFLFSDKAVLWWNAVDMQKCYNWQPLQIFGNVCKSSEHLLDRSKFIGFFW